AGATAASGAGAPAPSMSSSAGAGGTAVAPVESFVTEPNDEAAYLFDASKVRSYNILIAPADLAMLNQQPSAEIWVPAQLEFEGQTFGPLKVRYKGSDGSFKAPCTRGGADDPKAGKCSIKLGFDEVDETLRFFKLKKLNFHAMNNDPSLLRDRLGYSLFRDSHVVAPRAVHAQVSINGTPEGLFVAVEQIDGRFTRARFSEGGEGNVYKQTWLTNHGEQEFIAALETNSEVHDVTGMLAFKAAIQKDAKATEQFLDREYMARYLAVDRVIVNDDGALHFYCDPNSPPSYAVGNGNYYWYQSAENNRFWLIPWDLDLAFDGTPWVTIQPAWTAKAACTCVAPPSMYAPQMPPSCDGLVKRFLEWRDDYEDAVDEFIAGPFSAANVAKKLDAWTPQLEPFVMEAASIRRGPKLADWQSAVDELRAKIESQRTHRGFAY
ncbi:MAG TPA: CotH kinase family protein, partial [Polyangiales bacterium]|nr:CotH kinase family protein [Polyangiales bacterium]